ncbi:hypothetical protein [Aliiroseovarius marinus]|uniref:hypothetical protein n=1 Tax=Aliiroseovarius marinus TaxID=2500159 RepID=UPI00248FD68A|nr:hypothetical protein [Aliiroseovarius marinus]
MNTDWEDFSDSLEHWKWCEYLSVLDASMLAVGLNPSVYEPSLPERIREGHFHIVGSTNHTNNYSYSREFVPVFRAISSAVLRSEIPCEFVHHARTIPTLTVGDQEFDGSPYASEDSIDYDFLIKSEAQVSSNFEISPNRDNRRFYFIKEPDWERSTVKVDELKDWMLKRGRRPSFFFPDTGEDSEAFRNPAHEHFSAELDFAVTVWQALLPERKYVNGVKSAIEAWITANPEAWNGSDPISQAAKDRIITLVNWNKGGGAPKSGG